MATVSHSAQLGRGRLYTARVPPWCVARFTNQARQEGWGSIGRGKRVYTYGADQSGDVFTLRLVCAGCRNHAVTVRDVHQTTTEKEIGEFRTLPTRDSFR
eukprot:5562296-Pyramimonas_sp.AAC.1